MLQYKWLRYYSFVISFFVLYAYIPQISSSAMPLDTYVNSINALNKYRESGLSVWLIMYQDYLRQLVEAIELDTNRAISDEAIKSFLDVKLEKLAQLKQKFSDDYSSLLQKNINRILVRQYHSQLYISLLRYLTIENVKIPPVRSDALIILDLLQEQSNIPDHIKPFVDSGINAIKSSNFIENITEEDLKNARKIVTVLWNYLKTSLMGLDIEKKQPLYPEKPNIAKPASLYGSKKALAEAARNLSFSQDIKNLEMQQSTQLISNPTPIPTRFYREDIPLPAKENSPQKNNAKPSLLSQTTEFFINIKNKILSFFESFFKRSDDQPWQLK